MTDSSANAPASSHRLCVAPMMAYTDRHCRFLHRLLAPSTRLYTEMITSDALLHGGVDTRTRLALDAAEHPVACQLGGSEPKALARAARMAAQAGFDEVNLNVGCPSERVRKGAIGACLMLTPRVVADCVAAMHAAVDAPITVKCRIGAVERAADAADQHGDYERLRDFVGVVAPAGARLFIVHGRKAVLSGLTPAQNRAVPPLRPHWVRRLKGDFPNLGVVYNGGVRDAATAKDCLRWADGVMIGRAAYQNPLWFSRLASELLGDPPVTADQVFNAYLPYVERQLRDSLPLHAMSRHLHGLFSGQPGARRYRRFLAESDRLPGAGVDVLRAGRKLVR